MSDKPKEQIREELPERWSAQRRMDVVLRLLPGENLGEFRPRGSGAAIC